MDNFYVVVCLFNFAILIPCNLRKFSNLQQNFPMSHKTNEQEKKKIKFPRNTNALWTLIARVLWYCGGNFNFFHTFTKQISRRFQISCRTTCVIFMAQYNANNIGYLYENNEWKRNEKVAAKIFYYLSTLPDKIDQLWKRLGNWKFPASKCVAWKSWAFFVYYLFWPF